MPNLSERLVTLRIHTLHTAEQITQQISVLGKRSIEEALDFPQILGTQIYNAARQLSTLLAEPEYKYGGANHNDARTVVNGFLQKATIDAIRAHELRMTIPGVEVYMYYSDPAEGGNNTSCLVLSFYDPAENDVPLEKRRPDIALATYVNQSPIGIKIDRERNTTQLEKLYDIRDETGYTEFLRLPLHVMQAMYDYMNDNPLLTPEYEQAEYDAFQDHLLQLQLLIEEREAELTEQFAPLPESTHLQYTQPLTEEQIARLMQGIDAKHSQLANKLLRFIGGVEVTSTVFMLGYSTFTQKKGKKIEEKVREETKTTAILSESGIAVVQTSETVNATAYDVAIGANALLVARDESTVEFAGFTDPTASQILRNTLREALGVTDKRLTLILQNIALWRRGEDVTKSTKVEATQPKEILPTALNVEFVEIPPSASPVIREHINTPLRARVAYLYKTLINRGLTQTEIYSQVMPTLRASIIQHAAFAERWAIRRAEALQMLVATPLHKPRRGEANTTITDRREDDRYAEFLLRRLAQVLPAELLINITHPHPRNTENRALQTWGNRYTREVLEQCAQTVNNDNELLNTLLAISKNDPRALWSLYDNNEIEYNLNGNFVTIQRDDVEALLSFIIMPDEQIMQGMVPQFLSDSNFSKDWPKNIKRLFSEQLTLNEIIALFASDAPEEEFATAIAKFQELAQNPPKPPEN